MEVICLDENAFFELLDRVVVQLREKLEKPEPLWISSDDAMSMMSIKSKTTMSLLRNSGHLRFTQPTPKHILYDRDSILKYLDSKSYNTFKK